MDWDRAIEIKRAALTRIVAALIAMVQLGGGLPARLPRPVYRAVLLVLRPAEAAVRRLIVIAAQGVVAKPYPSRPMPAELEISRRAGARISFQLFDPPQRFDCESPRRAGVQPRIHLFGASPLVPMFPPQPRPQPEPEADDTIGAAHLGRRLVAVRKALDTLPRQAKRLARWRARRETMATARIRSPLRPGRPPGHRDRHRHEVDAVLADCHWLARDALRQNTS
jgi:hypothetical protein